MTYLIELVNSFVGNYRLSVVIFYGSIGILAIGTFRLLLSITPNGSDSYYQSKKKEKHRKSLKETPARIYLAWTLLRAPFRFLYHKIATFLHWQRFGYYNHVETQVLSMTCRNKFQVGPVLLNGKRRYYRVGPDYEIFCGEEPFFDYRSIEEEEYIDLDLDEL